MNRLCYPALSTVLLLASPATAAQGSPQPDATEKRPEAPDCALIEDGLKRLACYDARSAPERARKQATQSDIKAAEDAADALVYQGPATRDGQEQEARAKTGNGVDDSGVMSALVQRYVAAEKAIFSFSGSFVSHRPTYILPFTYVDSPNQDPQSPRLGNSVYDYDLDNKEAKYQISFKVPLLTGLLDDRTTLWFGYTQLSFWQVYNREDSAPFRETNFEPELFLRYQADWDVGPGTLSGVTLGFTHQSNGQSEPRSRSWNRITASAAYSYNRWLLMVQPWYRLPEDSSDDDNVDLERYIGYANYLAIYKWSEDRTLSLKLLNNLSSHDNRTSVELGYSFPIGETVKGFIQYYNGYGESLIDYNHRIHRIGAGIMLNDWL